MTKKGGVEFKGGSRHDRDRHNRRNRQNRQNRHGRLLALYFVGQAKGGQGALRNRQNRQNRHEGYPPFKPNPPLPSSWELRESLANRSCELKRPRSAIRDLKPSGLGATGQSLHSNDATMKGKDWPCWVRCSKLEPFCDTEKWAHLANLGWHDPNAHAKINQSSPNSLARAQFRQDSPKFRQNSAKICQISGK